MYGPLEHLIAIRNDLRRECLIFCELMDHNNAAIEPDDVQKVRDLIEVAISAIEDIPIG